MEDLKTAKGQLAVASEFRFVYWKADRSSYYTVAQGTGYCEGRWAVCDRDKFGACWTGEKWSYECRGFDAFRYTDLEEALTTARDLAVERNQEILETMEKKFPGQFRGGEYDLTARKEEV